MITVVDPDAARAALLAGQLMCPQPGCGGVLRVWSRARTRGVRILGGGLRRVRPDRARCRTCEVTHVLLPPWCVPRRAYSAEVVGAALLAAAGGAGRVQAAAVAGVPVGTARDWVRAVTRAAPALTARAIVVLDASGDVDTRRLRAWPPPSPLAFVVNALGAAARAFHLSLARPRDKSLGGPLSGIDYLALVAGRYRRSLLARLRLVDPTGGAASLSPWQVINVITSGQLLSALPVLSAHPG